MSYPPDHPDPSDDLLGRAAAPRTIAGRYRLGAALGAGGSGEVFRARDLLGGGDVAVKLLAAMSIEQLARVRREVAAMRILKLPGVVHLVDDGEDDGEHFIVMDLVEGAPFPGRGAGRTWESVGPRAVRLLESLALVHTAGVIHRDLKPANVLVDDTGRPTILDFGIARGVALGETITGGGQLVGTPRYLAPEQLCGQPADARADLYALGVMLFEALAGTPPHPGADLHELYTARVTRDAPSIHAYLPDLPRRVGLLVDRLLARRPEERPRSAVEALADLGEAEAGGGAVHGLPRLGDTAVLDAIVEAALSGRPYSLGGGRGTGRTRALRDAADRLAAEGRRVVWTPPGARPYESLVPLLGPPSRESDPGPAYKARLAELFREGLVLVVDGTERLDRWSSRLLGGLEGPILRVGTDGVALPPLREEDLLPLFHGPDRLLHLQEDGARELYSRAGGVPARVVTEVSAWVAAGLAEWRGGRLAIRRAALQQLAGGLQVAIPLLPDGERPARLAAPLEELVGVVAMAWPDSTPEVIEAAVDVPAWELRVELEELVEAGVLRVLPDGRLRAVVPDNRGEWPEERRRAAHRRIAAALPVGNPRRFTHLVAGADFADAAEEALHLARRHGDEGRHGLAVGVGTFALSVARQAPGVPHEAELLQQVALDAFRGQSVPACEAALYELGRRAARGDDLDALSGLLRASLAAWRAKVDEALEALDGVPPQPVEEVDRWRQSVRIQVGALRGPAFSEEMLRDVEPWARESPGRTALYLGWLGLHRYRQARFGEAADLHLRSTEGRETPASWLGSMLNAASATLEAYRLEEAASLAREAAAMARRLRLEALEARAEWLLRNAAWRLGQASAPDLELVDAAGCLGQPALHAQFCFTEAAVAWKAGLLDVAHHLATVASATYTAVGYVPGATFTEALAVVCRGEPDPARIRALAGRALRGPAPRLALQTLGLLALAAPALAGEWRAEAERLAVSTDRAFWSRRNEVLAVDEALAYCRRERE